MESVAVPVPDSVDGFTDAVTPDGSPVTLKLTDPENPFSPVMLVAIAAESPAKTVGLSGFRPSVKSAFEFVLGVQLTLSILALAVELVLCAVTTNPT